jgi:hypothetical protein
VVQSEPIAGLWIDREFARRPCVGGAATTTSRPQPESCPSCIAASPHGIAAFVTASPWPDALLADLGWLRALARSLARDPALGDDLAQEACLQALRHEPPRDG